MYIVDSSANMNDARVNLVGGRIEETIERLKWNLVCMFLSLLVLWCLSEMTNSRGHGLHSNSVHGKTGSSSLEPLNRL